MGKGRSEDPPYFIYIPTPDGYGSPYTIVPTDPLKLHIGVLTSLYTLDIKDSKKTGGKIFKPVKGLEHVARPFLDTTDLVQELKGHMQELALELCEGGDVGEHLTPILEAIQGELPQLFEHIALGEMHWAEGVLKGFSGKMKDALTKLALELKVRDSTIEGVNLTNERLLDTQKSMETYQQDIYINWAAAVEEILLYYGQIMALKEEVAGAFGEAKKSRGQIMSLTDAENPEFTEIMTYLREGDGEFTLAVTRFLEDPSSPKDIQSHIARAHVLMDRARQLEQETRNSWQKTHDTFVPMMEQISYDIVLHTGRLADAYVRFVRFRTELGANAIKPYELDEIHALCSEVDFNRSLALVMDPQSSGEALKQEIDEQLGRISSLIRKAPPSLPYFMVESFQMTLYTIRMCEDALSIPHSHGGVSNHPITESDSNGYVDLKRVETLYEIIIGIAYPLTCSSMNLAQSTIHSMLHIAEKLGRCTEDEVRLYRKALTKRLHHGGERVTAFIDPETEKGNQIKLWKNTKGALWVHYRNKNKWCLKLVESAAPKALQLMIKHELTAQAICKAKEARIAEKELLKKTENKYCRCRQEKGEEADDDEE